MNNASIITSDSLSQIAAATAKSTSGFFWQIVTILWSGYWPYILTILFLIIVYEILTWNGTVHYNSKNGFSPGFNRLVGSGTYLLLQTIVYGVIHFFGGDAVYGHAWPYVIHLLVFGSTGLLLNLVGFWSYWKLP